MTHRSSSPGPSSAPLCAAEAAGAIAAAGAVEAGGALEAADPSQREQPPSYRRFALAAGLSAVVALAIIASTVACVGPGTEKAAPAGEGAAGGEASATGSEAAIEAAIGAVSTGGEPVSTGGVPGGADGAAANPSVPDPARGGTVPIGGPVAGAVQSKGATPASLVASYEITAVGSLRSEIEITIRNFGEREGAWQEIVLQPVGDGPVDQLVANVGSTVTYLVRDGTVVLVPTKASQIVPGGAAVTVSVTLRMVGSVTCKLDGQPCHRV